MNGDEPFLDEQATEAALQEVLAEPPFGTPELGREFINRFVDWYQSTVVRLEMSHPVIFWTVFVLLSLLLLFLIWHISFSLRAVWRAMRSTEEAQAVAEEERGRGDLEPARAALRDGAYRLAIELAWAAVADAWTRPGERARTPRGQARLLLRRMHASHHGTVGELLQLHEEACYAGSLPDHGSARTAVHRASALLEEAADG